MRYLLVLESKEDSCGETISCGETSVWVEANSQDELYDRVRRTMESKAMLTPIEKGGAGLHRYLLVAAPEEAMITVPVEQWLQEQAAKDALQNQESEHQTYLRLKEKFESPPNVVEVLRDKYRELRQKTMGGNWVPPKENPVVDFPYKTVSVDFNVRTEQDLLILTQQQIGMCGALMGEQVYFEGKEGLVLGFLLANNNAIFGRVDWTIGLVRRSPLAPK